MVELDAAYKKRHIDRYQHVECENPIGEVWRWLRRFRDPGFTEARIRTVHVAAGEVMPLPTAL